jgi:hypothetical protein
VKKFISVVFLLIFNTAYSSTIQYDFDQNAQAITSTSFELDLVASQNMEEQINNFQSKDLEVINKQFQENLNTPTVALGDIKLNYRYEKFRFKYHRSYFTLIELQNPIFPRIKITQHNDHKFIFGNNFSKNKFNLYLEGQFIKRKFQARIYELDEILNDTIDYNPEDGKVFSFYRLNSQVSYQIKENNDLFIELNNIDSPNNPIKESNYKVGYQREDIVNSNLKLRSSFLVSSFPKWESTIEIINQHIVLKVGINEFNDTNKQLTLQYNRFKLSYLNKVFRNVNWKRKPSSLEGVSLSYTHSNF